MAKLLLLSTDGCHLCELAKPMIEQLGLEFEVVDIVTDPQLVDAYGASIPVLIVENAEQALFWPFEQLQIKQYVECYGISTSV